MAEKIENTIGFRSTIQDNGSILHESSYSTSDNSFKIECSRILESSNFAGAFCNIIMDSSLSNDGTVTSFKVGKVGEVKVVQIFSSADTNKLISILEPLERYSSNQKIAIEVNGTERILPKLQMSCTRVQHIDPVCQAFLFPEKFVVTQ